MNTKIIISIIVALLVGTGIFFTMNSQNSSAGNPLTNLKENMSDQDSNMTFTGDLQDLVLRGKPLVCTYSYLTEGFGSASEGTFYIDGKRVRADMISTDPSGVEVNARMIQDGTYMYIWDETKPKEGIKMLIPEHVEDLKNEQNIPSNEQMTDGPDTTYQGDYDCDAWKVDESLFTPPADITFSDFSEQFKDAQNALDQAKISVPANVKAEQCEICAQLTGDSQTQCKQSLGCS